MVLLLLALRYIRAGMHTPSGQLCRVCDEFIVTQIHTDAPRMSRNLFGQNWDRQPSRSDDSSILGDEQRPTLRTLRGPLSRRPDLRYPDLRYPDLRYPPLSCPVFSYYP